MPQERRHQCSPHKIKRNYINFSWNVPVVSQKCLSELIKSCHLSVSTDFTIGLCCVSFMPQEQFHNAQTNNDGIWTIFTFGILFISYPYRLTNDINFSVRRRFGFALSSIGSDYPTRIAAPKDLALREITWYSPGQGSTTVRGSTVTRGTAPQNQNDSIILWTKISAVSVSAYKESEMNRQELGIWSQFRKDILSQFVQENSKFFFSILNYGKFCSNVIKRQRCRSVFWWIIKYFVFSFYVPGHRNSSLWIWRKFHS